MAGSAESLPFDDQSFDAAMAVHTVHHWPDPIAGLREMQRVARRVVVFTFDIVFPVDRSDFDRFWLTRDYLPEVADLRDAPSSLTEVAERDRGPDRAGAHPVGLRRRLLRGLLAPTRGVPR